MKKLLLLAAALLLTLPAACMHHPYGRGPGGPGGPGGPMHRNCGCKCRQQQAEGQKPDCPSRPDCPMNQGQQPPAK